MTRNFGGVVHVRAACSLECIGVQNTTVLMSNNTARVSLWRDRAPHSNSFAFPNPNLDHTIVCTLMQSLDARSVHTSQVAA